MAAQISWSCSTNLFGKASMKRYTTPIGALRFIEERQSLGYWGLLAHRRTDYEAEKSPVRRAEVKLFVELLWSLEIIPSPTPV